MKFSSRFFFFLLICFTSFSCKNETNSTVENVDKSLKESDIVPVPKKKELTTELNDQVNSVMVKSMITPELKTFTSMLVTTGLVDMLSKKEGPYTVIGLSNEAFSNLDPLKMRELLNTANKNELIKLIKGYIIEGNLDAATLIQKIKAGNGSYQIVSMSGATYNASREGETIIITDVKGADAKIGKSDIKGANGVVHVLDKVLGVN
jgi:uncharacterized surface protein with fasciclin (FAS1) repeats